MLHGDHGPLAAAVGAHTAAQAAVATILAVVITIGTFWLVRAPVPVEFLR